MTDKELTEMAARAAGHDIEWQAAGWAHDNNTGREWNPLCDNGDAFELAVKLKLSVWFEKRENHKWTHIVWVSPVFEPYIGDVNAATRRAIVRSAAAMAERNAQ